MSSASAPGGSPPGQDGGSQNGITVSEGARSSAGRGSGSNQAGGRGRGGGKTPPQWHELTEKLITADGKEHASARACLACKTDERQGHPIYQGYALSQNS